MLPTKFGFIRRIEPSRSSWFSFAQGTSSGLTSWTIGNRAPEVKSPTEESDGLIWIKPAYAVNWCNEFGERPRSLAGPYSFFDPVAWLPLPAVASMRYTTPRPSSGKSNCQVKPSSIGCGHQLSFYQPSDGTVGRATREGSLDGCSEGFANDSRTRPRMEYRSE